MSAATPVPAVPLATPETPATPEAPQSPVETPQAPAFTVTKEQWDATQAELRVLKKAVKPAAPKAPETPAAPAAPSAEAQRIDALEAKLRKASLSSAVLREVTRQGYGAEAAELIGASIAADAVEFDGTDVNGESVAQAVGGLLTKFGGMLVKPAAPGAPPTQRGTAPTQVQQPTMPTGFLSMDEFMRMPNAVQLSPETARRLEMSKPYWGLAGQKIDPRTFGG
jgi:hypothetical protein